MSLFGFDRVARRRHGTTWQKRKGIDADGNYTEISSHEKENTGEFFDFFTFEADSVEEFAAKMERLAGDPTSCLVVGRLHPDRDRSKPQQRYWAADLPDEQRVIYPALRSCFVADIDSVRVPAGLGAPEHFEEAALFVRDTYLPPEFHDVECVATPTSSSGLANDDANEIFDGKLWLPLSRAYETTSLYRWGVDRRKAGYKFDDVQMRDGQQIFTARPWCDGFLDKFPQGRRAFIIPGARKRADLDVDLSPDDAPEPERTGGGGIPWKQSLKERFTGDDQGCFVPLTSAIGSAIDQGASADEFIAYALRLIATRGTLEKRRTYTEQKLRRDFNGLLRRDRARNARINKNRDEWLSETGIDWS